MTASGPKRPDELARLRGQVEELEGRLAELTRREAHYRTLVEAAPVAILIQREGRAVFANATAARLLGARAPEQLIGRRMLDLIHPDQRAEVSAWLAQAIEHEELPLPRIERFVRLDGESVELQVSVARAEHQGKPALLAFGVDLSAAIKAERALEHSKQALQRERECVARIAETSPVAIMMINSEGRITFANAQAERVIALARDSSCDPGPESVTDPEGYPFSAADLPFSLVRQTLDSVYDARHAVSWSDGRRGLLSINAAPLVDGEGRFEGMVASVEDITDRIGVLQSMAESEARFRNIVQSTPMGMHFYELRGGDLVFVGANPAADRILGVDHSRYFGRTIEKAFPPLAGTEVPDRYRAAAGDGITWQTEQLEYRDQRVAGAYEVYAFQTSPGRMAAMFLDITERRLAEQERARLEEQLFHSQKMEAIGRLAGGIAHDFNNLLCGINGYAQMIELELGERSPLLGDVQEIRQAGERASELTNQLLAFSRRQLIAPRVLSLADVVVSAEKMLRRIIGEDIDLEVSAEPGTARVRADRGQVDQILFNLVVNSRDAMPRGGKLKIEVGEGSVEDGPCDLCGETGDGPFATLSVADDGCGMDAETRARAFEPFFTTKEQGKGTGLGLAMVYGAVTQHDGHLRLHSRPGQGTRMSVQLPLVDAAVEPAAVTLGDDLPRGSERILLVEDDAQVRRMTCRMLQRLGYEVLDAADGEAALALFDQQEVPVQLLLTDVVMPQLNGRQLRDLLTERSPGIRTLFISGYTEEVIAHHGVPPGGVELLLKPFTVETLARRVREVLGC